MLNIDNGINLVKFSATWCTPCKFLSKTIDGIKSDFPSINFVDIDTDDYPSLSKEFKIKSVPTTILFIDKNEIKRFVGNITADMLKNSLKDAVSENV